MGRLSRRSTQRVLFAIFVVAGLAVAAHVLLSRGSDLRVCTATAALGWTVPLVTALLIAGIVMLLLSTGDDAGDAPTELRASTCTVCGSGIIDEWRMCPHCGALLECDTTMPLGSSARG